MTPRTVVIPGNGTNVLQFTIPANVDFNVESVVASVNAAAAGDTIGELSIAEVTGEVIATKRQGLPIPGGSSGTETWALRLDDETAGTAAGFANCAYAVVSASGSIAVGVPPTTTHPNLANFDTNATSVFQHDSGGTVGHSGGILIIAAGRYLAWAVARFLDPAGGAVEPQTSFMQCFQSSYNYNGNQSDWRAVANGAQGIPFGAGSAAFAWNPWDTDLQDIGAAFVGPPYSEYHVELFNAGTQTMNYTTALQVIRLGDPTS